MKQKKNYKQPKFEEIPIDVEISVCMTTDNTPPDPGDKPNGGQGSSVQSFEETKFNDNPFKK